MAHITLLKNLMSQLICFHHFFNGSSATGYISGFRFIGSFLTLKYVFTIHVYVLLMMCYMKGGK